MTHSNAFREKMVKSLCRSGCQLLPPLEIPHVTEVLRRLCTESKCLEKFYSITNGITCDNYTIFPLYNKADPKETWDSLEKENDIDSSKFDIEKKIREKFLIIGQLEGGMAILFDRAEGVIWFEDVNGYNQTNLGIFDFIEGLSRV